MYSLSYGKISVVPFAFIYKGYFYCHVPLKIPVVPFAILILPFARTLGALLICIINCPPNSK